MENKKKQSLPGVHLQLIKTVAETAVLPKPEEGKPSRFRGAFAQQLDNYADELDRLVAKIMLSE